MLPSSAIATVAFYAGLNGLILLALAVHVGRERQRLGILTGDGGNAEMVRAMRGQANFVEYVPLCLIQLAIMALMGAPGYVLHLLGIALTLGRVLHGLHFARASAPGWMRGAGAGLTLLVLVAASLGLIGHALVQAV